jgi:hypothetical protein
MEVIRQSTITLFDSFEINSLAAKNVIQEYKIVSSKLVVEWRPKALNAM